MDFKSFILVSITADTGPVPGTLCARQEYALDASPSMGITHTFIPACVWETGRNQSTGGCLHRHGKNISHSVNRAQDQTQDTNITCCPHYISEGLPLCQSHSVILIIGLNYRHGWEKESYVTYVRNKTK